MAADEHNGASGVPSLEANLASSMRRAQDALREQYHYCEDSVRQSPGSALAMAGLAGYLLRGLPLGSILAALVRVATALIRPALFLYMAAKLYERVQRASVQPATKSPASDPDFPRSVTG